MRGVYLLHFEPKYKHAGHYLGWSDDVGRRVYEHEMTGKGSRLCRVARAAGSQLHFVRFWPGEKDLERKFKKRTGFKVKCPVCKRTMTTMEATAECRRILDEV